MGVPHKGPYRKVLWGSLLGVPNLPKLPYTWLDLERYCLFKMQTGLVFCLRVVVGDVGRKCLRGYEPTVAVLRCNASGTG